MYLYPPYLSTQEVSSLIQYRSEFKKNKIIKKKKTNPLKGVRKEIKYFSKVGKK